MFKELLPLLRQRAVLMTVCVVEDGSLRVNIMPKKTGTEDAAKGGADSNTALTTPLSVTGTAEELDRDLPQAIVEFVASHLTLKQSLEATQAEMDAADKLAKAEAKNKFQAGEKAHTRHHGGQDLREARTAEAAGASESVRLS